MGGSYLEDIDSQLPAVQVLLGLHARDRQTPPWHFIDRNEALRLRGGRADQVVLAAVLTDWLTANNRITAKGEEHRFEAVHVAEAVRRLTEVPLVGGVVHTNEQIYHLLTLGTAIDVTIAGDTKGRQLHYIDWAHPERNVFHLTCEFAVERERSHETCRPDLVLFVNGIPLVVIECKRRDQDHQTGDKAIERAIRQVRTYEQADHIPRLFTFLQVAIATSVNDLRYGTAGTPAKYWAVWKEDDLSDTVVEAAANTPLPTAVLDAFFTPPNDHQRAVCERERQRWLARTSEGPRLATTQDRGLWAMLRPARLLRFIHDAVIFDAGVKKVARYQQWFAVQETLRRITAVQQGRRSGGVIWHTTGSGKSLTMVMLAKTIALHPAIPNARVILVTDREDLDDQLHRTFEACGKAAERAKTGEHLKRLVSEGTASVISTIINKFEAVINTGTLVDESHDIIVMVDESHRTNYGSFAAQMRRVFPNACYLAFTGTPLTRIAKTRLRISGRGQKKSARKPRADTAEKFGGFIHSYTMQEAVADAAVAPLIYEGRMAMLQQNQAAMDAWFERLTANLSTKQKADLKRKLARNEVIQDSRERLKIIAFDIAQHFQKNFKGRGLKGQVAANKRASAIRLRQFIHEFGDLRAEAIMSKPDLRDTEDDTEAKDDAERLEDRKLIDQFWREMMERFGDEDTYNKQLKAAFGREDGTVDLLIVVDKLLTGFDEPRNAVLYIDKSLKDHSILQAIARVNRLFPGKEYGLIIDYRGVLGDLNTAMQTYEKLADFDAEDLDLAGTLIQVDKVIADLPQHHSDLWAVFKEVRNQRDNEAMERHLEPEDRREAFYQTLRTYSRTLSAALASEALFTTVPAARIDTYKQDLKHFVSMRASVQSRYSDTIDFSQYEAQIRKMMDSHIMAPEVAVITPEVDLFDREAFAREVERHESPKSKADTIVNRVAKTCHEKLEEDPVFYTRFATLVQQVIDDYRQGRLSELEYLRRSEEIRDTLYRGHASDLPETLTGTDHDEARAFYGVLGEALGTVGGDNNGRVAEGTPVYDLRESAAVLALDLETRIRPLKVVDWINNDDAKKDIEDVIDDFLFDLRDRQGVAWDTGTIDQLLHRLLGIVKKQARG